MATKMIWNKPEGWSDESFRYQLLAWRSAIHLETKGMRHSSGRSARKHVAGLMGLQPSAKAELVIAVIEDTLEHHTGEPLRHRYAPRT